MLAIQDPALEKSLMLREHLEGIGRVEFASWLSDDILLVDGMFPSELEHAIEACLVSGDQLIPLEVRSCSYLKPETPLTDSRAGKVLTLRLLHPENVREPLGRLVLKTGTLTFSPLPVNLSEIVVDLNSLLNNCIAGLDAKIRTEILEFLSQTLNEHLGTTNAFRLSKSLFIIRDALRERLPSFATTPDQPRNVYVDHLLFINESSFYIRGWLNDPERQTTHLSVVSPEDYSVEIFDRACYVFRPDVHEYFKSPSNIARTVKNGFLCHFTTELPTFLSDGWLVQARNARGEAMESSIPPLIHDPDIVRNVILSDLVERAQNDEEFLSNHAYPALSQLQIQHQASVETERVEQYGEPNASPTASIIVPLYKRIDFFEQQLAQFAHDPDMSDADLIYVLDSPELDDTLSALASDLTQLYRIPFRIVTLKQNYGYSAANNVGASLARGRLLLLLNSDVLPDRPGWLSKLIWFYDSMPGIGALGAKLLFEDDTLQHAGIYFERLDNSDLWTNQHYFRGYHRHLPAANKPRPVPAVTGACMMVATDIYKELGGLQGMYLQGDFEDSDFCLRLIERGRKNWFVPYVELYHLEGQSYPPPMRQLTWKYNAWVHTKLWGHLIEGLMTRYPSRFNEIDAQGAGIDHVASNLLPVSEATRTGPRQNLSLRPPKVERTGESRLINLHLQNCIMPARADKMAANRRWIMNDSGAITSKWL